MTVTSARTKTHRGGVRLEPGAKRVRAFLGGEVVVDTARPVLVWEMPYYPAYYVPLADVRAELEPDGGSVHSPSRGDARSFTVRAGGAEAPGAALRYEDSPIEALRDLVRLDWDAMDAWFEEDEEVFTHPRDPYTRVDILASSRHVRSRGRRASRSPSRHEPAAAVRDRPAGALLPAQAARPARPARFPPRPVSHCPYKGQAEYWSVRAPDGVHEDLAWSYRAPLPESQKIAGLIAFYNEKVDIHVDGVLQERPSTKFS